MTQRNQIPDPTTLEERTQALSTLIAEPGTVVPETFLSAHSHVSLNLGSPFRQSCALCHMQRASEWTLHSRARHLRRCPETGHQFSPAPTDYLPVCMDCHPYPKALTRARRTRVLALVGTLNSHATVLAELDADLSSITNPTNLVADLLVDDLLEVAEEIETWFNSESVAARPRPGPEAEALTVIVEALTTWFRHALTATDDPDHRGPVEKELYDSITDLLQAVQAWFNV